MPELLEKPTSDQLRTDQYNPQDIMNLVNRLLSFTVNTKQTEDENIKILGVTTSMNDPGNNAKINFKNLLWYAPLDMQTVELTGMPIDQVRNTAVNVAIQKGADYLFFLDSDIFVDKHFLTDMMKKMEENKADIVVANYPFKDDTNQLISTTRFARVSDNKAINCYGCHKITEKDLNDPEKYCFVMAGLGAVIISTDILKKMDKPHFRTQNVNVRHVGEDAYFFQEAISVGAKIYVTIDTPIIHVNFGQDGKIIPFGTEPNVKLILPQIGKPSITIPALQQPPVHPPAKPGQEQQQREVPIPPVQSPQPILQNPIQTAGQSPHQHYKKGSDYKEADLLHRDSRISNIIDACRTHIKQGKVLDLGSGDGYLKKYLSNDVNLPPGTTKPTSLFEITQMDILIPDSDNIDITHNAEQAPYPFKDQNFDGIVCSELLEHLFNPHTVIAECYRILKPGGTMILTIPNYNSIDNIMNRHQRIVYNPNNKMSVEHIRHYTLSSITELVKGKFNIIRINGNSPNMNPFFNHARQILGKYIPDNKQSTNHQIYIDQIIGECFPDKCMGMMVILNKI